MQFGIVNTAASLRIIKLKRVNTKAKTSMQFGIVNTAASLRIIKLKRVNTLGLKRSIG